MLSQTIKENNMCYCNGYSGLAIADYFIKKSIELGTPVTNMAVLKMIYFAQGLAYPALNRKLIKDPFYAWKWGPVETNTYQTFSKYGGGNITTPSGTTDKELADIESNPQLVEFLDKLMRLANVNPFTLSEKTHEPGTPWDRTSLYDIIDDQLIEKYFCRDHK